MERDREQDHFWIPLNNHPLIYDRALELQGHGYFRYFSSLFSEVIINKDDFGILYFTLSQLLAKDNDWCICTCCRVIFYQENHPVRHRQDGVHLLRPLFDNTHELDSIGQIQAIIRMYESISAIDSSQKSVRLYPFNYNAECLGIPLDKRNTIHDCDRAERLDESYSDKEKDKPLEILPLSCEIEGTNQREHDVAFANENYIQRTVQSEADVISFFTSNVHNLFEYIREDYNLSGQFGDFSLYYFTCEQFWRFRAQLNEGVEENNSSDLQVRIRSMIRNLFGQRPGEN